MKAFVQDYTPTLNRGRMLGVFLLALLTGFMTLAAQQEEVKERKRVVAVYTGSEITIDGEMDEPAWQTAQPATDVMQRAPAEGQPARQPSVVRLLYDKEYLYVGAYLYDNRPDLIVVNDITRDSGAGRQDSFGVVLDTFRDRRNGYNLSISPLGSMRDTQFFNEGQDVNRNWDVVWHVETRIQEDGWTAEYAIPFKSLRFSRDEDQVWGVQFYRSIRRINESDSWMPIPSRFRNYSQRISYAGDWHGLKGVHRGPIRRSIPIGHLKRPPGAGSFGLSRANSQMLRNGLSLGTFPVLHFPGFGSTETGKVLKS